MRPLSPDLREQAAYAVEQGTPALEVRTSRDFWVFPYTHFLCARFNPSRDLVITFATHQVIVTGRNLGPLHQALAQLSLKRVTLTNKLGQLEASNIQVDSIRVISASADNNDTHEE
jgi:hypothetical protein